MSISGKKVAIMHLDESYRHDLANALSLNHGADVRTAGTRVELGNVLDQESRTWPDVVIVDPLVGGWGMIVMALSTETRSQPMCFIMLADDPTRKEMIARTDPIHFLRRTHDIVEDIRGLESILTEFAAQAA